LAESCQLEIEIVAVEESLNRVSPKIHQVQLELFILLVFPVLIDILLVEVILFGRDKRCLKFSIPEILPGEVF